MRIAQRRGHEAHAGSVASSHRAQRRRTPRVLAAVGHRSAHRIDGRSGGMTRRTSAYASAPASSTGNETTERREPRQVFGSAIGQGAELRVFCPRRSRSARRWRHHRIGPPRLGGAFRVAGTGQREPASFARLGALPRAARSPGHGLPFAHDAISCSTAPRASPSRIMVADPTFLSAVVEELPPSSSNSSMVMRPSTSNRPYVWANRRIGSSLTGLRMPARPGSTATHQSGPAAARPTTRHQVRPPRRTLPCPSGRA